MKAIGECIPFDDPKLPILHHVVKDAPQLMNDFGKRYPSAGNLRDRNGRTLHQATLASGTKTYKDNVMFFIGMIDEQVKKRDPGTDLYPFMVLASGHTSDLSAVYYLLKRKPLLIFGDESEERSLSNDQDESVPKDDGRKRKRG